jgi:hypothetical protein
MPDLDKLLDWNKSFSEQSAYVQSCLMKIDSGIMGIKYFDVESGRALYDNYVIFDPSRIKIKNKKNIKETLIHH